MEQIVSILKELPTLTEGVMTAATTQSNSDNAKIRIKKKKKREVRIWAGMYDQWPALEFSDLNSSILDLFTRSTSQSVASSLLYELTRSDAEENGGSIRLNNEEHLKWCMQVLNHSLTLSFSTSREYETLKGAVRIYLHWLRALCDIPDNNIPTPLLETPEKYFRNIIDALRWVFCRRDNDFDITISTSSSTQVPRGLAIERQSIEIEMILDSIQALTKNSTRKYQDEVWARSLSFLLNSSDLMLSEPNATEEMGSRICVRIADTLFDMWLTAVLNEHIPSMTYWSSLAVLVRRWRHNVPIIECWAKKILGLTVLVCKKMYGEEYLKIDIQEESVIPYGNVPMVSHDDDDNDVHLLYRTWYNMLCLFDSPAKILEHDAMKNESLNGNSNRRRISSISQGDYGTGPSQSVSLFLAATTLQRMVDLFYGDSRVIIDLCSPTISDYQKTPASTRTASAITDTHSYHTNKTTSTAGESSKYVSLGGAVGQIIVDDIQQTSLASGSSGKTVSTSASHVSKNLVAGNNERQKDASNRTTSVADSSGVQSTQSRTISENTTSTITCKSAPPIADSASSGTGGVSAGESISHIVANSTVSAPAAAIAEQMHRMGNHYHLEVHQAKATRILEVLTPAKQAQRFVTNFLAANQATIPTVSQNGPKAERMLNLVGDWLFSIVNSTANGKLLNNSGVTIQTRKNFDGVSDDVISGLSLHSVDLDDIPDAMSSPMMAGRSDERISATHSTVNRRKSVGSSCSSVAGESDVTAASHHRNDEYSPSTPPQVDGVTAARAAALATLTRIICAKSSNEKIATSQLSNFYATVFQTLVEKDRVMLCTLFYYGRNLFRLGLPGIESLLPHFLFALDIVMIESSKLRLHPSISAIEVRRSCLNALSSVICWPTTFGMLKIPQIAEAAGLKSNAQTYLHLRSRIFKTLMFSVRNETDSTNLHIALALCAILVEESCQFDLGLNEEQNKEMIQISTTASSTGQPEKGLCASIVRGVLSAICDKLGRIETIDHSTALAIIDVLNCISQVHHTVLFNNMDVSTGTLVIASLCRFIEQQLNKPPPMHSKDLHSTVVAAYNAVGFWLTAAPLLAECVGVLGTVCDVIQLGVTGSKSMYDPAKNEAIKPKAASQRVLEAAEALMYTLFCVVGRQPGPLNDERRLLHKYGSGAIDTTKFLHILVNGDTLWSLHEASHIDQLGTESAAVLYVRRSPMQGANTGLAKLKVKAENFDNSIGNFPPPTPMSAISVNEEAENVNLSTMSLDLKLTEDEKSQSLSIESKLTTLTAPPALSSLVVTTGSIISGVMISPIRGDAVEMNGDDDVDDDEQDELNEKNAGPNTPTNRPRLPPQKSIGEQFVIPPEFYKNSCKLDTVFRNLESTAETDAIAEEFKQLNGGSSFFDEARRSNVFEKMSPDERRVKPLKPVDKCSSIRVMLYDFGLISEKSFGSEIVVLDSGQNEKFYRDLHEIVDCTPARTHQTAHIFYVKEGQRNAVDILENALNIQNTCADFCAMLANLGEGIEIGIHDTWTGHWSTAFSSERKPKNENDGVDHYIIDGIQHALWWCENGNSEMAFLMPTERSVRMFKQTIMSPASSSRRGSNNRSMTSDDRSFDASSCHTDSSGMLLNARRVGEKSTSNMSERDFRPYAGGGSSLGTNSISRRTTALRTMLVWLERAEDMASFPVYELLGACDDGNDLINGIKNGTATPSINETNGTSSSTNPIAYHILFIHMIEPGIVQIRTKGTINRFGEAGPLMDGVVVSIDNLPTFLRLTILNSSRRDVAEIENYTFPHTRRKLAIVEFAKKYASSTTFEDFLVNLIQN